MNGSRSRNFTPASSAARLLRGWPRAFAPARTAARRRTRRRTSPRRCRGRSPRRTQRSARPRAAGRGAALVCVAPSSRLFACEITRWSLPSSSGRMTRCDAKYGGAEAAERRDEHEQQREREQPRGVQHGQRQPSAARARRRRRASSGARRSATRPFRSGTPSSATGASWNARTRPIFVGEPVVTSTNHGSATKVICEPTRETASATSSASSPRFRRITPAPLPRSSGARATRRPRRPSATQVPIAATQTNAAEPVRRLASTPPTSGPSAAPPIATRP